MFKKCKSHLHSVDESYARHFCFAFKYSLGCFQAGFMVLIHALIPSLFEHSATKKIKSLYELAEHRDTSCEADQSND